MDNSQLRNSIALTDHGSSLSQVNHDNFYLAAVAGIDYSS
jgi:hypothetical protein